MASRLAFVIMISMRPVVLAILDGWGYSTDSVGNAIASAKTPVIDEIGTKYPSLLLQASGQAVGMTFGEAGNSEVGHLTLGAGRTIFQYLLRIDKVIASGDFFSNPALAGAREQLKQTGGTLHIAGLLTSGAVHAHFNHLKALIEFAKQNQLPFRLHLFLDGRDSGLKEGASTLKKLSDDIGGLDQLATVIGRDFAMDRNNNWKLTETAYNLIANATGNATTDIFKTLEEQYHQNVTDADIPATIVHSAPIADGDAIVFFNFREDSMRQLLRVFVEPGFDIFLKKVPERLYIATMTEYLESPAVHVLFAPPKVENCLAEVLGANGKKHLHIAETEKYAHVTFFFNGLHPKPFPGETDFFLESPENIIQHPQMRAADIAQKISAELDRDYYDFFVVNFANGDMLAHLGILEPAIKGVEAVDTAIGVLKQKILEKDGILLITADHGNAESMIYRGTGEKETKHDTNPVPFYVVGREYEKDRSTNVFAERSGNRASGIISDVAPTVLELINLPKPAEMTGDSLLPLLG